MIDRVLILSDPTYRCIRTIRTNFQKLLIKVLFMKRITIKRNDECLDMERRVQPLVLKRLDASSFH